MQSPNPNSPQILFNQSHFTAPVIQTFNKDSSTAIFNFGGTEANVLEVTHNEIREQTRLAEGTGSWLYASTADSPAAASFREFRDEFEPENNTLLCSGYPLVGKTVLASVVKQHLADLRSSFPHPSVSAVSALYLGRDGIKELSYHDVRLNLLKNLAWQCRGSGHRHPAFDLINASTSQHESMKPQAVDDCFASICQSLQAYYIVVDGLDEYPYGERQLLMQFLKDLQSTHGAKIKLFVTFRFLQEIADFFHGSKSIQLHAHDDDIALFVRQQILKSPRLHGWVMGTCDLKENCGLGVKCGPKKNPCRLFKISNAVLQAAGKMFFIAKYHMKILTEQQNHEDIEGTIDQLPHLTPSDIYRDEVKKIRAMGTKDGSVGLQILKWVFYSGRRSVGLDALRYALALGRDATEPPSVNALLDPNEIGPLTRDLVVVNMTTRTVSGFHRTVYTYFDSVRWLDFPDAADLIISRSARHLSFYKAFFRSDAEFLDHVFTDFAMAELHYQIDVVEGHPDFESCGGQATVKLEMQPALKNISSTLYSCNDAISSRSTLVYTKQVALSRKLISQLLELANDASVRTFYFSYAPAVHQLYGIEQRSQPLVTMVETPLHFAAVLRCKVLAEILLKNLTSVDNLNHHKDTALTIAMKVGCVRVLEVLLQKGASFDLQVSSGWEVLLHTIEQDHYDMAQQVLEKAAERAKKKSKFSRKASGVLLLQSVYAGHADLSSALKRCRKHPDLAKLLGTALLVATDRQHDHIIDQLLTRIDNKDMNVDYPDRVGNTALHRAARRNHAQMVAHLLDKSANANIKNTAGHTPWHTISHLPSHSSVSRMLIRNGADPNTRDREGVSNLYTSAAGGHVDAMRLILEAGTDPGIRTAYGWSPLHWAAGNGHLNATELLLEWQRPEDGKKADVNCLSDTTETPLDRALVWNHTAVIELLKEHGARTGRELCGIPGRNLSRHRSHPYSEPTRWLGDTDDEEFQRRLATYFEALTIDQEVERTFGKTARGTPFWKKPFISGRRPSTLSSLASPLPPLSRPDSSDASARYFDSDSDNERDT